VQQLAGNWIGAYEYVEPHAKGSTKVGFTLEIFDGPSWRVRGRVLDDQLTGMAGFGTISGWSLGRRIWFQKVMPVWQLVADPKPIPLDDYLREQFGDRLADDPGPYAISYRGVIGPNLASVSGTWTLPRRRLFLSSGRVMEFPLTRGGWKMRRA
jgi:hypothetical protein